MSVIVINATDTNKVFQQMDITVKVRFEHSYYKNYPKWKKFMQELEADFEQIAKKYFDDNFEIDTLSNHEFNKIRNQH